MTIAVWMILVVWLLAYVAVGFAKSRGGYDNRAPRPFLEQQPADWRKRAFWAHQNTLEALPLFIAGVLVAEWRQAPQAWVDGLAVLFLLLRIAYLWAYVADRATVRSAIWTISLACPIGMFAASI
ncbi:MAG: hypothetical protein EXQ85_01155 [Alphaproteobacteria bacterium]|nr:hypothetical protein [Alphaproteobacteria bacterium]